MSRRLMLIMTRPLDDSFEAFENFRRITTLKSMQSKKSLINDDLVNEWEKFWACINKKPSIKICIGNYSN